MLLTLHRLATAAQAALLEAMLDAGTLVEETGHRDVASWLAHQTHQEAQKCGAELKLARGLAAHPGLADALRRLPTHGGTPISLVATIEMDRLTERLRGAGLTDTDDRISAAEARRLACAHGVAS